MHICIAHVTPLVMFFVVPHLNQPNRSMSSSFSPATHAAAVKYGISACQAAYAAHRSGNGANTIAQTTSGLTNTASADAAIDAGREMAEQSGMPLTAKESAFLALCLNYGDAASQIEDNYSNAGIGEAMALFDGEHPTARARRQAAGGLLSSLRAKGLGHLDTEFDQFNLTVKGIHAVFIDKAEKSGA